MSSLSCCILWMPSITVRKREVLEMKLHYMGKYDLNPESLPYRPHQPDAVPFKEAKDSKTLALLANALSIIILIPLLILLYLRCNTYISPVQLLLGSLFSVLIMFPHEFLHAICFKEEAYVYTNLKHGLLFIVGPETMSKRRFIFMSMLPNLVFGIVPFIIAMINPSLVFLGIVGSLAIGMGAGDYYNVFNAATQMPKGARTYLYQFNSFWYMPSSTNTNLNNNSR